jgi:hypothetical protein
MAHAQRVDAQLIDLRDYLCDAAPRAGRLPTHDLSSWRVIDDWPEKVAVSPAEVDVFERWFGEIVEELFGPL